MEYKKNDTVQLEIVDIGMNGEGIGKINGFTLFVKDAIIGDLVEVKIMKAKKNYGYAKLTKIIKSSPFRQTPKCEYASKCGGCQIQQLSYEKQLQFKEDKVRNDLLRIGGFEADLVDAVMKPIVGMDQPYHYRNKAQYPIGTDKDGNLVAGFYAGRTHSIISNTACDLGPKVNEQILECILAYMKQYHIPAYDELTHSGLVRHVLIRSGFATGEILVCIVINGKTLPEGKELVQKLLGLSLTNAKSDKKWQIVSVGISSNTKQTNVIMGNSYEVLFGKGYIKDYIGDIAFHISPLSFYQVNPEQTKKLYDLVLKYADLSGTETVWDLYCGIGTISLFLAQKAGFVYGVEIIKEAIDDAVANANLNRLNNTKFYVGKAEEVLPREYEENNIKADVIVVDPPRKGCDENCLHTMIQMAPKRIVYVSCDPASLARDLKYLCENGYQLEIVEPVDQFAHTVHVETVVLMTKKIGRASCRERVSSPV